MKALIAILFLFCVALSPARADCAPNAPLTAVQFNSAKMPAPLDSSMAQPYVAEGEGKQSAVERRLQSRLARIEKNFKPSDESVTCLPSSRNSRSSVLSDKQIFFRARGRGYMADLTSGCKGLQSQDRYQMNIFGGRICRGQILTVLDNFGREFGSCTINHISIYDRKKDAEKEPSR